jgi:hypothetical protein
MSETEEPPPPGMTSEEVVRAKVFFPNAYYRNRKLTTQRARFAYYTSADTALRILGSRQLWFRDARVMNDFREIEYGLDCVRAAWNDAQGEKLRQVVDGVHQVSNRISSIFDALTPAFKLATFLACFSEHGGQAAPEEDKYGRLSMWRAYGGDAGVAFVIHGPLLLSTSFKSPLWTAPVEYLNKNGVAAEMNALAGRMLPATEFLRSMRPDDLVNTIVHWLRFAIIATKHPAFREEREWRLIYSPIDQNDQALRPSVESIGGIPQTVMKLDLVDRTEAGGGDLSIGAVLERILIGPTEHSSVTAMAFARALNDGGYGARGIKIFETDIPLRKLK